MKQGYLYIFASTILISSTEVAMKIAGSHFNGLILNCLRFFIGALVLLPVAKRELNKCQIKLKKEMYFQFMGMGFLFIVLSMTFYQMAIKEGKASTVAILFSTNPIFSMLLSVLIYKYKIRKIEIITTLISVIGLIVIINPINLVNFRSVGLGLIAAIIFGFYGAVSVNLNERYKINGVITIGYTFLFGAAELLFIMGIWYILMGQGFIDWNQILMKISLVSGDQATIIKNIVLLGYISVFVTAGGFATYFLAIDEVGISIASVAFFLKPALAPVLAYIVLGEQVEVSTALGISILVIGSWLNFSHINQAERVVDS